ncbi:MAG: putative methyltransferase [Candidatus Solibacter sp.]|jgi:16S rRNA (guanine966-N2)-methyltransferase|nr:putative methyltransferase [Candidatus Solibacter sp.]
MRIISGEFRSRRLKSLPGDATRPTSDRLRETIFDILQTRIEGAVFVDAYAGTGAVGIEALSRGARHVFFLEKNRAALDAIRQNLATLNAERRATVYAGAALLTLARCRTADIVFLDPPYDLEQEYSAGLEVLGADPPALTIAQHSIRLKLADRYGKLERTRLLKQGDNALSFYAPADLTTAPSP